MNEKFTNNTRFNKISLQEFRKIVNKKRKEHHSKTIGCIASTFGTPLARKHQIPDGNMHEFDQVLSND